MFSGRSVIWNIDIFVPLLGSVYSSDPRETNVVEHWRSISVVSTAVFLRLSSSPPQQIGFSIVIDPAETLGRNTTRFAAENISSAKHRVKTCDRRSPSHPRYNTYTGTYYITPGVVFQVRYISHTHTQHTSR